MNSTSFRMPARRLATVATATALAAGPVALTGVGPAHATGDHGRASAVVLRTGLDVSLLNKSVDAPLAVSLNEVQAPRSAEKTALTARLDGVNGGQPFSVLRAEAAEARATATAAKAEGSTTLARARVHVPGLPLLAVIEIEQITAKAVCEAGKKPVATTDLPGSVTVLGKRVTLTAGGPTDVEVPGVGDVRLDLSKTRTTTRTAAATALELKVSVNPLKLNVAEVNGTLTLAEATCETPKAAPAAQPPAELSAEPSDAPAEVEPQGAPAEEGLAETGGSSTTPYVMGGAIALLAVGGGAVALARRRS
ncbi:MULTISPECIES: SCO1860 family LAETG-anchored protein [Streptomyces]|uniref:SCO1860 family LAETG-anchored protein n=1 Tax=Streptomyces TaxID=1883 RepID=UPI00287F5DE2|nr:SCO1860 family LAETG-anchored protein [Streptomyces sp. CGMCC 4.1456]WNF61517.1 SCO1860 family LAETG-anchored protein [Streptomyces sp. CGMCC 4.1456]